MQDYSLKGPLGWSVASIVIICAFTVYAGSTLVAPLLSGGLRDSKNTQTGDLLKAYDEYTQVDIERFNGRSAFYSPIRIIPPRPPAKEEPKEEAPTEPVEIIPAGPPAPPSNYTGPPLIAIIGEEAWFRSTGTSPVIRLREGEEKDGLKLVKTMQPSSVKVEHRRGEYDVPLFTNEEPFFREEPPTVSEDKFFEEVES
ncbi:MAG: hypothetical protein HOK75_08395 [Phycisphaerae bacterium]|jgi:hypothetical protein|nr:hypothetical protein [Phycisphaerae bacterium]MBT5410263.1 hypothetical protein [Phycisphaerae bacterium]